jgi:hypothetical protein
VCTLAVKKKNLGRFRHVGSDHSLVRLKGWHLCVPFRRYVLVELNRRQAKQSREEIQESVFVGSLVISVATSHSSLVSDALSQVSDKCRN